MIEPVYNPILDALWDKRRGETKNGALYFPLRFGLTRKQVEALIASGEWLRFRSKWQQLRYTYQVKNGLTCTICGGLSDSPIVIGEIRYCKKCTSVIDKRMLE